MSPELTKLLSDPILLQRLVAALVLLAALFLWLWRRSVAQTQVLGREAKRGGEAEATLSSRLSVVEGEARDLALRAGGLDVQVKAQETRLTELSEERDGLTDALHDERKALSRLERELAEVRLAARKDHESATRELHALRELREEMSQNFKLMANETLRVQGADMQRAQDERLSALLTPFRDQVQRFQSELQTRNKVMDEEGARLRAQIEFLHQRSEDISREAVALTRALKGDRQKQGAWGEMILERLLEDSGLEEGVHYLTQTSQRDINGKLWRPDVIVRMPQQKALVIDSKVSLLAYEEAVNTPDPDIRDAALKRHIASLRAHVAGLASKGYQALDDAAVDYVLMFIPIEGAFSEALRSDPELARFAMEKRVGLATPTTLMLTLRTVDHIWTVERRETNAMEIAARAGQLYDKVHGFVSSMELVGKSLDSASRAHGQAMDRLTRGSGNVIRQVEMLRELGARTQKRIELDHDVALPSLEQAQTGKVDDADR